MPKIAKISIAIIFSCATGLGAYWYYSPYLAFKELRTAANKGNVQKFSEYIDYPRVRKNLKDQLAEAMNSKNRRSDSNDLEPLGRAILFLLYEQMLDEAIQPQSIMNAIQTGEFWPLKSVNTDENGFIAPPKNLEWNFTRLGVNRINIKVKPTSSTSNSQGQLIFERKGFSTWSVTKLIISPIYFSKAANGQTPNELFGN